MRSKSTAIQFNKVDVPADIFDKLQKTVEQGGYGFDFSWWKKEQCYAIFIHHDQHPKFQPVTFEHLHLLQYASGCWNTATQDDSLDLFDISGEELYNIKFSDMVLGGYSLENLTKLAKQGKLKLKRELSEI